MNFFIKFFYQINKRDFPDHIFTDSHQDHCKMSSDQNSSTITDKNSPNVEYSVKKVTFFDLFYPKSILFRSLNMFYQWFSVTMCYYGLSYASTSLLGDPYTNFSLSVFIEIPGKQIFPNSWSV